MPIETDERKRPITTMFRDSVLDRLHEHCHAAAMSKRDFIEAAVVAALKKAGAK